MLFAYPASLCILDICPTGLALRVGGSEFQTRSGHIEVPLYGLDPPGCRLVIRARSASTPFLIQNSLSRKDVQSGWLAISTRGSPSLTRSDQMLFLSSGSLAEDAVPLKGLARARCGSSKRTRSLIVTFTSLASLGCRAVPTRMNRSCLMLLLHQDSLNHKAVQVRWLSRSRAVRSSARAPGERSRTARAPPRRTRSRTTWRAGARGRS